MAPTDAHKSFAFGAFRFSPADRTLLRAGQPVQLGGRAMELLIALAEHPGEVMSAEALMRRVWPRIFVDPANLRVHVAALRKALGEEAGRIENIAGRGYRFYAPVMEAVAPTPAPSTLPRLLGPLIGREAVLDALAASLPARRLLTLTGPGGIGKTSLALAAAERAAAHYPDGVHFVSFAALTEARHVAVTVAAALGLPTAGEDVLAGLVHALHGRTTLVVLDNCEHVVEEAAELAEAILRGAPHVHLLATSREGLRAEGEWIERLAPLPAPQERTGLTADDAMRFPAVALFVERARARLHDFTLSDAEAAAAAELCRRLDGVPLAIEFAAARVDVFGVTGLAERLDDRFALLRRGRRVALPRQQTLRATLDWSYDLLGV